MSAFHARLSVVQIEAHPAPTQDPSEQPETIRIEATLGLPIPIGPSQVGVIGLGTIEFLLDREGIDKIVEAGASLPAKRALPPDFTIANDMSAVERAAQEMRKATGL